MRAETRDRNHQKTLGHNPLLQEIQQQKNSVVELQSCEITGPDDPTIARIEFERLKLHDLKLKLAVAKQVEVDLDITNATKDVSVQTDKNQMQTAWGIWRHYRSSISTDGCHGLPSRMKTNTSSDRPSPVESERDSKIPGRRRTGLAPVLVCYRTPSS